MRTLGDPVRLEIVALLADRRPRACGELSTALGMPASAGSYHLRLLREAGIARARADGTVRHVRLRREGSRRALPGSSTYSRDERRLTAGPGQPPSGSPWVATARS